MVKKQTGPKAKSNLVKELDAAITLLTRVRALAVAGETEETTSPKATKTVGSKKTAKRVLSTSAREAIAAAQKKRWAKVRRQKKQAERAALAK
ncbi:MAG: hypothetical protein P4K83_05425 [Terracidiphilus sp.]|nr:hypothetical protein [Terracidiphilus sp.]